MVSLELSGAVWNRAGTFGTTRNLLEPLGIVPNVLELAGTDRNQSELLFWRSMALRGTVQSRLGSFGIIQLFGIVQTAWNV